MDTHIIWQLRVTPHELYLLAGLMRTGHLIGLEDPFQGFLADEMEDQLYRSKDELVSRGFMLPQPDGSLALDAAIVALILPIALATHSLIVSRSDLADNSQTRLIHGTPDLLVEQETLPNGQIALTAVRDTETLEQRLRDFVGLPNAPAGPGEPFSLTESDLAQARRAAEEGRVDESRGVLSLAGLPEEAANVLSEVLHEGSGIGSVVRVRREPQEIHYEERLAWFAGPQGAWVIEPAETAAGTNLRFRPADTTAILEELSELVRTFSEARSRTAVAA